MSDERPDESAESGPDGILIVRILDAPRQDVFDAWTHAERFAAWFGEHGTSVPVDRASMDVRPGGEWHAVMLVGTERTELHFSGTFLEIEAPERLVLTVTDREHPGPEVEVLTVVLDVLGDGRTRMTFTQRGGNLDTDGYEGAMQGWLVFFERLGGHLKTRHDAENSTPPGPTSPGIQRRCRSNHACVRRSRRGACARSSGTCPSRGYTTSSTSVPALRDRVEQLLGLAERRASILRPLDDQRRRRAPVRVRDRRPLRVLARRDRSTRPSGSRGRTTTPRRSDGTTRSSRPPTSRPRRRNRSVCPTAHPAM